MAQAIETYQSKVTPNVSGPGFVRPDAYVSQAVSQGLNQVAQSLGELDVIARKQEEEEGRAWASSATAKTRLEWSARLSALQETAQPGAPGFTPNFLKEYDEYSNTALQNAPRSAKRFMGEKLSEIRTLLGERALTFEGTARIDNREDQFTSAADLTAKLMNTDPSQYRAALDEQLAIIDGSNLPPVKKSARREKTIAQVSEAAAWTLMRNDPVRFLDQIGVTGKKSGGGAGLKGATGIESFDALSFDNRVKLVGQALTLQAQRDADADKRLKEMNKTLEQAVLKDMYAAHADGKLTRGMVDKNRDYIGADEYKSLLKMLKGDGPSNSKSDHGAVRDILTLMMENPAEARKKAFQYHQSGLITDAFLSSTVGSSRSYERQEGPKSQYELSRDYITKSLDPGPFVKDPVEKQRMAEAVSAFDTWYRINGQKWSDKDVEARGRELVQQFQMTKMGDSVLALPQPRGSVTIPRNASDPAAINGAILRAYGDLEKRKGAMSAAEYDIEMKNLQRWKNAVSGGKK